MLPKSPQNTHPVTSRTQVQLKDIEKRFPFRVLTSQDWEHWTAKGYIIIRQAVPTANVERLVELLWEFDEKDPNNPTTWYARNGENIK